MKLRQNIIGASIGCGHIIFLLALVLSGQERTSYGRLYILKKVFQGVTPAFANEAVLNQYLFEIQLQNIYLLTI